MDGPKNIVNVDGDCYDHVDVSSYGIWSEKHGESIFQHALVRLHVQLLVVFFLINCFHFVLKRFHFSRFTSEFLVNLSTLNYMTFFFFMFFPPCVEHLVELSFSILSIGFCDVNLHSPVDRVFILINSLLIRTKTKSMFIHYFCIIITY